MIYHILNNPDLSWKGKGIFVTIATMPQDLTSDKLVDMSSDGTAGVRSGVNELIEKGLIKRIYTSGGAQGVHAKFVVIEK